MYFLLCARFSPLRNACKASERNYRSETLLGHRNAQKVHGLVWVYDIFMRLSCQKWTKKIDSQCSLYGNKVRQGKPAYELIERLKTAISQPVSIDQLLFVALAHHSLFDEKHLCFVYVKTRLFLYCEDKCITKVLFSS